MAAFLPITGGFENTKASVIAAMLYPRNDAYRAGYCLRNEWARRAQADVQHNVSTSELLALMDAPSRQELASAAEVGTKHGTVAGDLLALIYEDWRLGKPEPSLRAALRRYREWSPGKKYRDGSALLYSDWQLRRFWCEAKPSAHLWAAQRLLKRIKDRGKSYRTAFTPDGMPYFLGVASELQNFATTFTPKRVKPPKPIIGVDTLLLIPAHIQPMKFDLRPL